MELVIALLAASIRGVVIVVLLLAVALVAVVEVEAEIGVEVAEVDLHNLPKRLDRDTSCRWPGERWVATMCPMKGDPRCECLGAIEERNPKSCCRLASEALCQS